MIIFRNNALKHTHSDVKKGMDSQCGSITLSQMLVPPQMRLTNLPKSLTKEYF